MNSKTSNDVSCLSNLSLGEWASFHSMYVDHKEKGSLWNTSFVLQFELNNWQISFAKSFYIYSRQIYLSVFVWLRCEQHELCTLQSNWINLSNSSDDYAHASSVLGRSHLSWNSETSFFMHKNKSVLESFLLSSNPPHDIISVLMPVPSMLFLVTTEEPLSHWQCFGKHCCCPVVLTGWYYGSYWYHLSRVFLAGTSKCLSP